MSAPTLSVLPDPPDGQSGWPWTEESSSLPTHRPDGSEWPTISIVTPSYNQGEFIEETIRSILLQRYPNLEYIIIDGGSTDDTSQVIQKYDRWIDYWVSEPDDGQADAINKGARKANGVWFNWINSDDLLAPNALRIVGSETNADMVAGCTVNFGDGDRKLLKPRNLEWEKMLLMKSPVYHQPSIWLKRKNLEQIGFTNSSLKYCFDYEMIVRYNRNFEGISYTDEVIAFFRLHDASKTVSRKRLFWYDKVKIWDSLKQDPQFNHLKVPIAELRDHHWSRMVWARYLELIKQSDCSKPKRLAFVILRALESPRQRASRFTMGALKQILFS